MLEAAGTSETLVNLNQTTRRCNPEDSHLRNDFTRLYAQAVSGLRKKCGADDYFLLPTESRVEVLV
jgi:hypothetical protein